MSDYDYNKSCSDGELINAKIQKKPVKKEKKQEKEKKDKKPAKSLVFCKLFIICDYMICAVIV